MKTKLLISAILGIIAFAFVLNNNAGQPVNPPRPPGNISSQYLIGAMDCGYDLSYEYLNDLGLNVWHKYVSIDKLNDNNTVGWDWYSQNRVDNLYNTYETYSGIVTSRLDNNQQYNMRTLMQRPKVEQLAFGQRSDYQCEENHLNEDLWFYAFNNHDVAGQYGSDYQDITQYGSGQWVRHCMPNPYNAPQGQGYVVRRLKANNEQCNTTSPIGSWQGDLVYDWYVKPSIRADKDFINNPSNYEVPICRIDILNYDGNLIKSVELRSRHFKPGLIEPYDGKYKEDNFNFTGNDSTLFFPHQQAKNFNPNNGSWPFNSRGTSEIDGDNKMDIRVYWFGSCEIFIDYVRVDNDVANDLLSNNPSNPNWVQYDNWLHWEAQLANYNTSPLKFYIEEFEFNNIPCMSYVSRKLRNYSGDPNLSLMSVVNLTQYNLQLPVYYVSNKKVSATHILRYLIDSVGESQVFSEPYSLTGYIENSYFNDPSYVPNTFENYSYNVSEGKLGQPTSVQTYENWLQNHLDDETSFNFITKHGYFSWYIKTMDTMSKANDIAHINMPQAHLWFTRNSQGDIEEALREPTNEELKMITYIPITYGARGTWYFWFGGWGDFGSNSYGRGLTNPIGSDPYFTPRTTNVYGQNKWQNVIDINTKLKAWGPTLMSFTNADRHSYIYRLADERDACLNESYFADIVTYYPTTLPTYNCVEDAPDENPPPLYWQYDCKQDRYLQVATFENAAEENTNYFMLINRRCSPYRPEISENGGRRKVKVKFDYSHPQLEGFNVWKITDLGGSGEVFTFNKTLLQYIDLGEFIPGEGRLYKMEPSD